MTIYAWVGEDEFGSGRVGLKQGRVPAGYIPLVAMDFDLHKLTQLKEQLEIQASAYGKRIYLAKFEFAEVVDHTGAGAPWPEGTDVAADR